MMTPKRFLTIVAGAAIAVTLIALFRKHRQNMGVRRYLWKVVKAGDACVGDVVDVFPDVEGTSRRDANLGTPLSSSFDKDEAVKVYIVDGYAIRRDTHIDYTMGGHGYVYDWIPKGEIWIDDGLAEKDIQAVVLHELLEHCLMKSGMDYDHAHEICSKVEQKYRREENPTQLFGAEMELVCENAKICKKSQCVHLKKHGERLDCKNLCRQGGGITDSICKPVPVQDDVTMASSTFVCENNANDVTMQSIAKVKEELGDWYIDKVRRPDVTMNASDFSRYEDLIGAVIQRIEKKLGKSPPAIVRIASDGDEIWVHNVRLDSPSNVNYMKSLEQKILTPATNRQRADYRRAYDIRPDNNECPSPQGLPDDVLAYWKFLWDMLAKEQEDVTMATEVVDNEDDAIEVGDIVKLMYPDTDDYSYCLIKKITPRGSLFKLTGNYAPTPKGVFLDDAFTDEETFTNEVVLYEKNAAAKRQEDVTMQSQRPYVYYEDGDEFCRICGTRLPHTIVPDLDRPQDSWGHLIKNGDILNLPDADPGYGYARIEGVTKNVYAHDNWTLRVRFADKPEDTKRSNTVEDYNLGSGFAILYVTEPDVTMQSSSEPVEVITDVYDGMSLNGSIVRMIIKEAALDDDEELASVEPIVYDAGWGWSARFHLKRDASGVISGHWRSDNMKPRINQDVKITYQGPSSKIVDVTMASEDVQKCSVCGKPTELSRNTANVPSLTALEGGGPQCKCKCPTCGNSCFDDTTLADHGECYDCYRKHVNDDLRWETIDNTIGGYLSSNPDLTLEEVWTKLVAEGYGDIDKNDIKESYWTWRETMGIADEPKNKDENDITMATPRDTQSESDTIKIWDIPTRSSILVHDGDKTDLRLFHEDQKDFIRYRKKEYEAVEKALSDFSIKKKDYEISMFYDVSGFTYWSKPSSGTNYMAPFVRFDKEDFPVSALDELENDMQHAWWFVENLADRNDAPREENEEDEEPTVEDVTMSAAHKFSAGDRVIITDRGVEWVTDIVEPSSKREDKKWLKLTLDYHKKKAIGTVVEVKIGYYEVLFGEETHDFGKLHRLDVTEEMIDFAPKIEDVTMATGKKVNILLRPRCPWCDSENKNLKIKKHESVYYRIGNVDFEDETVGVGTLIDSEATDTEYIRCDQCHHEWQDEAEFVAAVKEEMMPTVRDVTMSADEGLTEWQVIQIAKRAYPKLPKSYDEARKHTFGDLLADFIVVELNEAVACSRAMFNASEDLKAVAAEFTAERVLLSFPMLKIAKLAYDKIGLGGSFPSNYAQAKKHKSGDTLADFVFIKIHDEGEGNPLKCMELMKEASLALKKVSKEFENLGPDDIPHPTQDVTMAT